MTDSENKESRAILEHFGEASQLIKIGEECSELTTVILKSLCSTKNPVKIEHEMYGELADVYNVMLQAELIFDFRRVRSLAEMKRRTCINSYRIETHNQQQ